MRLKQHFYSFLFILSLLCILTSCHNNSERKNKRSFCYWKTKYVFSDQDKDLAKHLHLDHLYIRYFDVKWDKVQQDARPIGVLKVSNDSLYVDQITPSVFFTNDIFLNMNLSQLDTLAFNIKGQIEYINRIYSKHQLGDKYSDILIDCDWSKRSKEKFFYFLEKLKKLLPDKEVTTTLRLWQYKNQKLAGIPPVNRVLLMCYNLQAANNYDVENSIVTLDEIKKYTEGVKYPLIVDLALPVFSWSVFFRNKEFKGVVNNALKDDYFNNRKYTQISPSRFILEEEMVVGKFFARPGDEVRVEGLSMLELNELADYLFATVKMSEDSRLTFFSWDIEENSINNMYEIENIYNRFDH